MDFSDELVECFPYGDAEFTENSSKLFLDTYKDAEFFGFLKDQKSDELSFWGKMLFSLDTQISLGRKTLKKIRITELLKAGKDPDNTPADEISKREERQIKEIESTKNKRLSLIRKMMNMARQKESAPTEPEHSSDSSNSVKHPDYTPPKEKSAQKKSAQKKSTQKKPAQKNEEARASGFFQNIESQNPMLECNGIRIKVLSIELGRTADCSNCSLVKDCSKRRILTLDLGGSNLGCTILSIEVSNATENALEMKLEELTLIDSNAYAHSNVNIDCSILQTRKVPLFRYSVEVPPSSRRSFGAVFPELENELLASALLVNHPQISGKIEIARINDEPKETLSKLSAQLHASQSPTNIAQQSPIILPELNHTRDHEIDLSIRQLEGIVCRLELLCYSRMHNTLVPQERVRLDNMISNLIFSANQKISNIPPDLIKDKTDRLNFASGEYKKFVDKERKEVHKAASLSMKIEGLDALSGREFEEWVADLFRNLGFSVSVTPLAYDHGIDIICEKDKKLTGIQCKRYKGTVSAPEVQKFVGALQNAGIPRGYLVTTGVFSIGAERAAANTSVILCDKSEIQKLIDLALGIEPEVQYTLF